MAGAVGLADLDTEGAAASAEHMRAEVGFEPDGAANGIPDNVDQTEAQQTNDQTSAATEDPSDQGDDWVERTTPCAPGKSHSMTKTERMDSAFPGKESNQTAMEAKSYPGESGQTSPGPQDPVAGRTGGIADLQMGEFHSIQPYGSSDLGREDDSCSSGDQEIDPGTYKLVHFKSPEPKMKRKRPRLDSDRSERLSVSEYVSVDTQQLATAMEELGETGQHGVVELTDGGIRPIDSTNNEIDLQENCENKGTALPEVSSEDMCESLENRDELGDNALETPTIAECYPLTPIHLHGEVGGQNQREVDHLVGAGDSEESNLREREEENPSETVQHNSGRNKTRQTPDETLESVENVTGRNEGNDVEEETDRTESPCKDLHDIGTNVVSGETDKTQSLVSHSLDRGPVHEVSSEDIRTNDSFLQNGDETSIRSHGAGFSQDNITHLFPPDLPSDSGAGEINGYLEGHETSHVSAVDSKQLNDVSKLRVTEEARPKRDRATRIAQLGDTDIVSVTVPPGKPWTEFEEDTVLPVLNRQNPRALNSLAAEESGKPLGNLPAIEDEEQVPGTDRLIAREDRHRQREHDGSGARQQLVLLSKSTVRHPSPAANPAGTRTAAEGALVPWKGVVNPEQGRLLLARDAAGSVTECDMQIVGIQPLPEAPQPSQKRE